MTQRRTFGHRFTRRGRLENRWAAALAQPDARLRLRSLLDLVPVFVSAPQPLATLWPSYLWSVLNVGASELTADELSELEAKGAVLAATSGGLLPLTQAWWPLIATRAARGDHDTANMRMATLYWWAHLPPEPRAALASDLAARGANSPSYWPIYVEHLVSGNTATPAMTAIITAALSVDFDSSPEHVTYAGGLAARLVGSGVEWLVVWQAVGYAALLADDPSTAADYLERAAARDAAVAVSVGLAAAWVRGGAYHRLRELSAVAQAAALVELGAVLHWLADPGVGGPCPGTAARLAELSLDREAGPWLAYAVGRLHLLEGNALAAARFLNAAEHPRHPEWRYYEAWAWLLLGDHDGVARCAEVEWEHRWLVECLLLEADGGADEPRAAGSVLGEAVVRARVSLTHKGIAELDVELPPDTPVEVVAEVVRTGLGVGLSRQDLSAVARWMRHAVLLRLPLADRLLWTGLVFGDNKLLEQAADELRYQRATLVLAVSQRDPGRLERLEARTGPTVELLRAWAEPETADTRLATVGGLRSAYWRGRRSLARGDFAAAAVEFAVGADDPSVPRDAAALAQATAFAANPGSTVVNPWPEGTALTADSGSAAVVAPVEPRNPWLDWTAALTALTANPATADLGAFAHLVATLTTVDRPPVDAVRAVAAGLARARIASDGSRADRLGELLRTLAGTSTDPEVRRSRALADAAGARCTSGASELSSDDPLSALTVAEHALAEHAYDRAVRALRAVPADGTPEAAFSHFAADVIAGDPVTEPVPTTPPLHHATQVLLAAARADQDPRGAVRGLVPVLREHDLRGVVDLRDTVPWLLADLGRRRVPDHLVHLVRAVVDEWVEPLQGARLLTRIGDYEAADVLWRRALPDSADEYVAVLRHRAVLAGRDGDRLAAAGLLLSADRVAAGRTPLPTLNERAALDTEFREETRFLTADLRLALRRGLEQLRRSMRVQQGSEDVVTACRLVLGVSVDRLLGYLLPGGEPDRPGRHHALEDVIAGDAELLFVLLDGHRDAALGRWRRVLHQHSRSVTVHRALAVVHRERALADDCTVDELVIATGLWVLLLSSTVFWRQVGEEGGLREDIAGELLAAHAVRGAKALDAGVKSAARQHLRALVACTTSAAEVMELLADHHVPYKHAVDADAFREVAAVARRSLDGWVNDLLDAARRTMDEDDDRKIAADYEGALRILSPFQALGVPVRSVLETGLDWYNEWCTNLYLLGEKDELADVVERASTWTDSLIPLCDKADVLAPANAALSRHLMLRGYVTQDANRARTYMTDALEWDASNSNAHSLLMEMVLADASDEIKRKRYTQAMKALESAGDAGRHEPERRQLLVSARIMRSRTHLDNERYEAARQDLVNALDMATGELRDMAMAELAVLDTVAAVVAGNTLGRLRILQDMTGRSDREAVAMALNARAVAMVEQGDGSSRRRKYADALHEVLEATACRVPHLRISGVSETTYRSPSDRACAVCGPRWCANRTAVVDSVVTRIHILQVFHVADPLTFWQEYRNHLCLQCAAGLALSERERDRALLLLDSARLMAPNNRTVRKNIDAIGGT